jgi:hypothetical protein
LLVDPSAHGGHVFAVPAQLFGALTFPPPLFVQVPVQFRFVAVLYPQMPPQFVPIPEQFRVPHFLIEVAVVHDDTQVSLVLTVPQKFVPTQVWFVTVLLVHPPEQEETYVP